MDYMDPLFTLARSLHGDEPFETSFGLGNTPNGSVLAYDDALTNGYHVSTLLISRVTVALDHVLTLHTVVDRGSEITALAPWTLLRSSLEGSVAALWLASPLPREERVLRALRMWHQVIRERLSWERDARWVEQGGTSLEHHRAAILQTAADRGYDPGQVRTRPTVFDCIQECSTHLGIDQHEAIALWRESSGVSHGYDWATLRLTALRPRERTDGGIAATMHIDESQHAKLAHLVHAILEAAVLRYSEICQPEPS